MHCICICIFLLLLCCNKISRHPHPAFSLAWYPYHPCSCLFCSPPSDTNPLSILFSFSFIGLRTGLGYHSASLIACLSLRPLSFFLSFYTIPFNLLLLLLSSHCSRSLLESRLLGPSSVFLPFASTASGFKSLQLPRPKQRTLSQLQPLTGLSQAQTPPSLVDCGLPSPVQRPFSQSEELRRPLEVQDRIRLKP